MLIFLDSSILCSDFYMKNAYFCGIKKIGTIVLGQIVVDETVNKYREMLSDIPHTDLYVFFQYFLH